MPRSVTFRHDYARAPQAVWDVAVDTRSFARIMAQFMTFRGLPDGPLAQGMQLDLTYRLFGLLPPMPYHIRLDHFDPGARHFVSVEWGRPLKRWRHALWVKETPTGACLIDEIDIDAGILTPFYVAFARYMYPRRHQVRMEILNEMKMETA